MEAILILPSVPWNNETSLQFTPTPNHRTQKHLRRSQQFSSTNLSNLLLFHSYIHESRNPTVISFLCYWAQPATGCGWLHSHDRVYSFFVSLFQALPPEYLIEHEKIHILKKRPKFALWKHDFACGLTKVQTPLTANAWLISSRGKS